MIIMILNRRLELMCPTSTSPFTTMYSFIVAIYSNVGYTLVEFIVTKSKWLIFLVYVTIEY